MQFISHGRLTKDIELTSTPNGTSKARFSLACDRYAGPTKGTVTEYPNFVAFGKQAETLAKHTRKGSELLVVSKFTSWKRQVEGEQHPRTIVDFEVEEFEFCGKKEGVGNVQASAPTSAPAAAPPPKQQLSPSVADPGDFEDMNGDDGDLPF